MVVSCGRGYQYLGGPVTGLADVRHLGTARALVAAYELNQSAAFVDDSAFVDVVRFEVEPLMRLRAPEMVQRPWPTYPMGFLNGQESGPVPVWVLQRTRVPRGAEMWRIHRSGQQEMLFDGIARGWRSAPRVHADDLATDLATLLALHPGSDASGAANALGVTFARH